MQPIPVENIADGGENSLGAQPLGPPRGAGDCRDLVSVSNQQRDKQAADGSGRAGQKYPQMDIYLTQVLGNSPYMLWSSVARVAVPPTSDL